MGGEAGRTVTSKVLALLGAFEDGPATLTLTQLAEAAGVPKPTAHRLAQELVEWGALRKDRQGRYRVGRRIWKIGQNAGRELRDSARRHLSDLLASTGQGCQLAIRDGDQALLIDRLDAGTPMARAPQPGDRFPLHAGAVGLVLLAFEPEWIRDAYLARLPGATVRMAAEAVLATRHRGYALTAAEIGGGASLAVPVLLDEEHAVAAIGLVTAAASAPSGRLAALQQAAARMAPEALRWPNTAAIVASFVPPG